MLSYSSVQAQYYWERLVDRDYGYNPISNLAIRNITWTGKYLIGTGWRSESKLVGPYIMDTAFTLYFGYSLDSGKTWTSVEPPVYAQKINSIRNTDKQFIVLDSMNIIVCGGLSSLHKDHLLRSMDGGKSWFSFVDKIDGLIHDPRISFFNNKKGIMAGSNLKWQTNQNVFYHTEDGGITWTSSTMSQHKDTTSDLYYNDPIWLDSTTVFNYNYNMYQPEGAVGGKTPHTFRTFISYDAGYTWNQLGCRIKGYEGDSSRTAHFLKVYFPTSQKGYAFGRIYRNNGWIPATFVTNDKGLSWSIADTSAPLLTNYLIQGQNFGQDTFLLITQGGKIRYTIDGGTTWKNLIDENIINHLYNETDYLNCAYFYSLYDAVAISRVRKDVDGKSINNPPVYRLRQGTVSVVETESTVESSGSGSIYNVYPQPASQSITFDFYAVPNNSDITFKIYTMYGVEVGDYTEQLQKASSYYGWRSMKLDVSLMPSGLYIADLEAGNRSDSFSFVVVK
jgi:photosystem II stability/assembly factor-like uncharacterized protein